MLAASREDASKGYRGHGGATNTIQLLSNLVPTFKSFITDPRGGMVEQLNMLWQSHTVCSVIGASSRLANVFLTHGLSTALCTWNLRVLAQLLFVDSPVASIATATLTAHAGRVSSPLITFPVGSPLRTLMSCSCSWYELLHRRNSSMKVRQSLLLTHTTSVWSLYMCIYPTQEAMGSDLLSFHDEWKARCAELLRKAFPPAKFWKVLGRKSMWYYAAVLCCFEMLLIPFIYYIARLTQLSPSAYCQAVNEHLLLPVVEVASALPLEAQRNFVYLTISVFVQQFRRTLTANKKTYRCVSFVVIKVKGHNYVCI